MSSVLIAICSLLLSRAMLAEPSKHPERSLTSQAVNSISVPEDVEDSLACLLAEPWDELNRLVDQRERSIVVRFTRGALPSWPRESETKTLNLTIYSTRGNKAVLLFTEPQGNRRILVIDNGYTLVKSPRG